MFDLLASGTSLLTGILNGIFGERAHEKYAQALNDTHLHMAGGIKEAESIYQNMANNGLPGKDLILQDLLGQEQNGIAQAKTVAESPSALLEAITRMNGNTQNAINSLDVKDAETRNANTNALARFLSLVEAPAENRIDQFEANKKISIAKEHMLGTKDLLGGIENGIGSALSTYGSMKKLDYLNSQNDALKKYWGIG